MEENSSFEYEKKNGYVVITALKGDPSVVEIPGMLDGSVSYTHLTLPTKA